MPQCLPVSNDCCRFYLDNIDTQLNFVFWEISTFTVFVRFLQSQSKMKKINLLLHQSWFGLNRCWRFVWHYAVCPKFFRPKLFSGNVMLLPGNSEIYWLKLLPPSFNFETLWSVPVSTVFVLVTFWHDLSLIMDLAPAFYMHPHKTWTFSKLAGKEEAPESKGTPSVRDIDFNLQISYLS